MRGSLNPDTLARVLRGIAISRREGILHLSREGVSKRIYFKDGALIFAGSDDEQERLGEVLVRAGKLERPDLELALKVMKETGESLGKTVVEMGFTSPADIAAHALERTKSIVCSVFAWPSGTFYFEERPAGVGDEMALDLSTTETILEAARTIEDLEVIRRGIGDLKAVLRQPTNPLLPFEDGSVSSSVEWLLYQANGASTIEEIVAASPLDESKTLRSIYALVLAGILEIETPERAIAARTERTIVNLAEPQGASLPPGSGTRSVDPLPKTVGRYEVERIVGRGAMGAVYLAKDPAIDRMVAIKLIQTAVHLSASELEKYRERFYREAKAAGKLLHPGIVTVFDVGHTDDATPFIVMEYIEGKTLQEILKTETLEHARILRISEEILEALAYAHSKGVVHRDVKPANILVADDGGVKIMDFGIAHVVGSELTQADDVLGSPHYMAPEQLSKGTIDARTDLFAFGVVLYRMLSGALPFRGDSFAAIAKTVLFDEPPPLQAVHGEIPHHWSAAVARCLAKDASHRFASANELSRALHAPVGEQLVPETEHAGAPGAPSSRSSDSPKAAAHSSKGSKSPPPARSYSVPSLRAGESVAKDGTHAKRKGAVFALAAAGLVAVSIVVFAIVREPPASDRTLQRENERPVTPTTSPPSEVGSTDGGALPSAGDSGDADPDPSTDAELYHEASVAFERGNLDASRSALEELLRRNPAFEGAPELLVRVHEQRRSGPRSTEPTGTNAPPEPPASPRAPAEAQLFYEARRAFESGDFEGSKRQLEALLQTNPSLEAASELLVKVHDEMWKKTLPLSFRAKHNHRIGDCAGTFTLAAWGVAYSSPDHEWEWRFADIRLMERQERSVVNLETHATEVLGLGKPKNYKFELRAPMRDEDWSRYERLARQRN